MIFFSLGEEGLGEPRGLLGRLSIFNLLQLPIIMYLYLVLVSHFLDFKSFESFNFFKIKLRVSIGQEVVWTQQRCKDEHFP